MLSVRPVGHLKIVFSSTTSRRMSPADWRYELLKKDNEKNLVCVIESVTPVSPEIHILDSGLFAYFWVFL